MNPGRYELKSPDNGAILAFEIRERWRDGTRFDVFAKTPRFSGTATSSTYMVQPLQDLFRDMAAEWTGWDGEKSWRDLESIVDIVATSDKIGHISILISLDGDDGHTQLRTCLMFEAGQLQEIATEVARLFA